MDRRGFLGLVTGAIAFLKAPRLRAAAQPSVAPAPGRPRLFVNDAEVSSLGSAHLGDRLAVLWDGTTISSGTIQSRGGNIRNRSLTVETLRVTDENAGAWFDGMPRRLSIVDRVTQEADGTVRIHTAVW